MTDDLSKRLAAEVERKDAEIADLEAALRDDAPNPYVEQLTAENVRLKHHLKQIMLIGHEFMDRCAEQEDEIKRLRIITKDKRCAMCAKQAIELGTPWATQQWVAERAIELWEEGFGRD